MKLAQKLAVGYIRTKFRILSSLSKRKAAEKAFQLFRTPQRRHKKPLPKIFDSAEKLQFNMDGIIVRGWGWNQASDKKILIIHGYESSITNFDRYIRLLIRKGYGVFAFDAPAHGRSSGRMITAPLYKETIKKINLLYGPVKNYIAHSFGGLAVALALEEISHTNDYKLVLIAPATETPTAIDSFFKFLQLDPAVRHEFEKVIIKTGGVSSEWYSVNRAMKHIRAKVLWIHDEEDDTTPFRDALAVKEKNYPNVEFVITRGLGHSKIYRDTRVIQTILDFL
jgi:pimeloyl-ACP methyl ester carboxylesterase